jgi:hypothetical protein
VRATTAQVLESASRETDGGAMPPTSGSTVLAPTLLLSKPSGGGANRCRREIDAGAGGDRWSGRLKDAEALLRAQPAASMLAAAAREAPLAGLLATSLPSLAE